MTKLFAETFRSSLDDCSHSTAELIIPHLNDTIEGMLSDAQTLYQQRIEIELKEVACRRYARELSEVRARMIEESTRDLATDESEPTP